MFLSTFLVYYSTALVASRTIHTKVEEEMKDKILDDGIYHFTSKEAANKIMESGYVKPSNGFISYGSKKCYFFPGKPKYQDLLSNLPASLMGYEYTAVKLSPNNEELNNFKQRKYSDNAIVYKGKCDLPDDRAEIVDLVLDLNERGEVITRRKTEEEIEKGEYVPSEELKKVVGNNKTFLDKTKINLKSYAASNATFFNGMKRLFNDIKNKVTGNGVKALPKPKEIINEKENNNFENVNDLKDNKKDLENSKENEFFNELSSQCNKNIKISELDENIDNKIVKKEIENNER